MRAAEQERHEIFKLPQDAVFSLYIKPMNQEGRERSILRLCGNWQGYLAKLGLSNLVSVGMLSINVLFGSSIQVSALDFLPNLEAVTGIPTGVQLPPASSSCS